ncbi:TPA: hypothetical protein NPQ01_004867 [Klebsiella variicola subsp. variicola]|uniref:hypothetical protein n=1 Tax=Klebsiella TaxID=570 RepID=UPI0012B9E990|nr:hypothetical protein [Klebsiella variicola]EIY5056766.1 hypothetical protein [Klebsiella variicola]MCD9953926.1 hypothetical protein [Klebsiella variicola subsp. variicola]QTI10609.1 hypothetical protein JJB14_23725 [Klebsiella variicola]HBS5981840.1 hypothetical protein [Klebsiella variicola]HCI6944608.1 hypothetical protein [Klebsiella variicola subsp. variicola]
MKRLLVLTLTVMPVLTTHAGQITLILSDEQETDNAKICIYSNVIYTETVAIRPTALCKHTQTFVED